MEKRWRLHIIRKKFSRRTQNRIKPGQVLFKGSVIFFLFLKLKINLRRQVTVLGVHDVPLHTWFVVWFPSFNTWPDIHEDTQEVEFWKQLIWSVALYKSWTRSSLSQACTGRHKTGKIENRPENECHLIVLYRLILSKLWRIIIGSWKNGQNGKIKRKWIFRVSAYHMFLESQYK